MNSEEEFYDAETGETGKWGSHIVNETCFSPRFLPSLSSCPHQGWSQMIPARSALKTPWCLTVRRWRTAARLRRMEYGSAGKKPCRKVCMHILSVCMHVDAWACLQWGGPEGFNTPSVTHVEVCSQVAENLELDTVQLTSSYKKLDFDVAPFAQF